MRPVPSASSSSILRCLARPSVPLGAPLERIPPPRRLFHPPRPSTLPISRSNSLLRPSLPNQSPWQNQAVRFESSNSDAAAKPATSTTAPDSRLKREQVPSYELTFTCKVCTTRSSHRVSKQGYHHGTVLISCPGCKNRHLISDHMKIFSDKSITVEDILRQKGNLVKRGTLSGDVELWDDGTTTERSAHFHPNTNIKGDPDAPEGTLTAPPESQKSQ